MKILTYSPSVEAYIETTGKGNVKTYYNVSDDIVSCNVVRNSDTHSTFSMRLQNKKYKYNNIFTPMDKITIYATKTKRVQLFTGYINKVDRFTLYPKDFSLSGSDTIYRFEKLYWDKNLTASQRLFADEFTFSESWTGFEKVIRKLTYNVASWPNDNVILGQIPADVISWAREMYNAQLGDYASAEDMISDFYSILQTSGPSIQNGTATGYTGKASSKAVEAAVEWMISISNDNSHGYSMSNRTFSPDIDCSSFVYYALINNGWTTDQLGSYPFTTFSEIELLEGCGWTAYDYNGDPSTLRRGDIMWVQNSSHQHTEMYIGGNQTVGAHDDYDGMTGDSSGNEVSVVTVGSYWEKYIRYTG